VEVEVVKVVVEQEQQVVMMEVDLQVQQIQEELVEQV